MPVPASLPQPSAAALAHSDRLVARIRGDIETAGGWISFADYMAAALYAPGLGYYTAGAKKFGGAGDFVTAPELSPLFGQALARQAAAVMAESGAQILEIGAGSGRLAADLLQALEKIDALPERYAILDVSADLRERQAAHLAAQAPRLAERVVWLEQLPPTFSGFVFGNEVLDAMPVHLVVWRRDGILEQGVGLNAAGKFVWQTRPATGALLAAARALAREIDLPDGFLSEISLSSPAWVADWGSRLVSGLLLLIDYGFPRHEFYHPQRATGTLMCHYRHHAHPDPFFLPGLQDLTAHVDFTALADAAFASGLEVLGYTDQASFLLNCGVLEALANCGEPGSLSYLKANAAVQKLIAPQEMGELFKVIAFGKKQRAPLLGFARGDRLYRL